ncbi:MAG: SpoIIIAH-like family protein [Desulfitobacteriaceae bacterium]|nr:SpoIIIAH-like family protein [Desulfitobacteriaceae bacterium]MDD4752339.1 SpoIIIAH-like family protein [Desulfitobacteriaceae bacterium]
MRVLTVRKNQILIVLLGICLLWLVFSILSSFISSSQAGNEPNIPVMENHVMEPISQFGDGTFELIPSSVEMEDFFVNYRMDREKIRSQQVEILKEIIDNPHTGSAAREKAQEDLLGLTKTVENELKLENLIKAKQYQDAAVFISPDIVTVVVKGKSIDETDSMRIIDFVSNTTGHSDDEVIITTKN